jgi:hypothetical protein
MIQILEILAKIFQTIQSCDYLFNVGLSEIVRARSGTVMPGQDVGGFLMFLSVQNEASEFVITASCLDFGLFLLNEMIEVFDEGIVARSHRVLLQEYSKLSGCTLNDAMLLLLFLGPLVFFFLKLFERCLFEGGIVSVQLQLLLYAFIGDYDGLGNQLVEDMKMLLPMVRTYVAVAVVKHS